MPPVFPFQKAAKRSYIIPPRKTDSLSNCSSIQPSIGNASTGKRFCQRLKRSRTRLVGGTGAASGLRSAVVVEVTPEPSPEAGAASSQFSGKRNSKLRSSAAFAVSSFLLEVADNSSLPSIFHSASL